MNRRRVRQPVGQDGVGPRTREGIEPAGDLLRSGRIGAGDDEQIAPLVQRALQLREVLLEGQDLPAVQMTASMRRITWATISGSP